MSIDLSVAKQALSSTAVWGLDQCMADFVEAVNPISATELQLVVSLPVADDTDLMAACVEALQVVEPAIEEVEFSFAAPIAPIQSSIAAMANVKNTIVVASGKGGVGKSTTSVNLALALKAQGASVGILDADIYGPSVQMMMGVAEGERPRQKDANSIWPVQAHGLQTMSMGYLVDEKTPMVWRGPMASGALQQMLKQTAWFELDYLIIDMPPGTGDIQLTLSQQLPVTGAVVVTTPQNIALLDAQKAIEMFRKVGVPILGVVENMSYHECSACGHRDAIFGSGGGERLAQDYDAQLLGCLPLLTRIREQADSGKPTLVSAPNSDEANHYKLIARRLAAGIVRASASAKAGPTIEITDE